MNLNITFAQKDAAKAAFRAAGIPLAWDTATRTWKTSASALPEALVQYASTETAETGVFYYIAQRTDSKGFGFHVEACFDSKADLIAHILNGKWLSGWVGGEAEMFAEAAYVVQATKRIGLHKSIPNQYVTGYNRLCESKNPDIKAAVLAAMNSA